MKIIKLVLILAVLVVGLGPFGMGFYLQDQHAKMLERLNNASNGKVIFKGNFVRGYLSSTATTEIVTQFAGQESTLALVHEIHQGPILLNFTGVFDMSSYIPHGFGLAKINTTITGEAGDAIKEIYGEQPAYSIVTMVDFFGSAITKFVNNPIVMNVPGAKLDWKGFDLTVANTRNFASMDLSFMAPSFNIAQLDQSGQESGTFTMTNLRADVKCDFTQMRNDLNFTVDSLVAVQDTLTVFSLEKMVINGSEETSNNLTSGEIKYAFNNLLLVDPDVVDAESAAAEETYGPFEFTIKVANIDRKVINEANQNMMSSMEDVMLDQNSNLNFTPEQIRQLLAAKPKLDINFKLDTSVGSINVVTNAEAGGADLQNADITTVLATIHSTTKFTIAANLLNSMLTTWGKNQINMAENRYAIQHAEDNTPNPYDLTTEVLNSTVYSWVSQTIDYLKLNKFLIEQEDTLTANIVYQNNTLNINDLSRSTTDMQQLEQQLVVKVPGVSSDVPATPDAADNTQPNSNNEIEDGVVVDSETSIVPDDSTDEGDTTTVIETEPTVAPAMPGN